MRLQPEEVLAKTISAAMQKGGWLLGPLGGMALIYLLQDRLVFNPVNTPAAVYRGSQSHRLRALTLTMPDGIRLRGWWLRPHRATPGTAPAVVYFGGRSEEVSWISRRLGQLIGMHAFFVNYRGYGESQGRPSERALFADALGIYDWIGAQPQVDPDQVAVIGRSLGSGVAAYLAAERPVGGVILITPYDSLVEIACRRFPYCGARLLLKHRFEALRLARRTRAPALILLAESDTVIPKRHAVLLIEAWGGHKEVLMIPTTNHCDIQEHPASWCAIRNFLAARFNLRVYEQSAP
jgi:pimeloyl-ACP methyl ester carboxylesterase